jgi:hypothetical protein
VKIKAHWILLSNLAIICKYSGAWLIVNVNLFLGTIKLQYRFRAMDTVLEDGIGKKKKSRGIKRRGGPGKKKFKKSSGGGKRKRR